LSVRRLAPPELQPASFAFNEEMAEKARWWIAKYPPGRQRSAVIPLLWLVQKQEGWVSEPAIRVVAEMLDMAVIRVLEVATFYTMFQLVPVGSRALIQVCGTTPCLLRGAGKLLEACEREIGPRDQLSRDGLFTWQEVECLGACCNAPMAQINDLYYEDMTAEDLAEIVAAFRRGETPPPGSRRGRTASEPDGGPQVLLDETLYDGSRGQKIELPNRPAPKEAAETGA
jgi:NADH-quinone oxidoreductase subunit E